MDAGRKALFESLDNSGRLDPVRAQLRAVLFAALRGASDAQPGGVAAAAAATQHFPAESLLVHELIREYLLWAGMQHTLSVFAAESRLSPAAVPRLVLASEAGVAAAPSDVPLLFAMLHECKNADF
jgi:lisH domain-containing protein FOPNL